MGIAAAMLVNAKIPDHPVEIYDSWKEPDEYKKRGGGWMGIAAAMLVNAKIPEDPLSLYYDRDAFLRNIEEAMRN